MGTSYANTSLAMEIQEDEEARTRPTNFNQCVFVRGFRMGRRMLLFPRQIRAAAHEGNNDGPSDGGTSEAPLFHAVTTPGAEGLTPPPSRVATVGHPGGSISNDIRSLEDEGHDNSLIVVTDATSVSIHVPSWLLREIHTSP